MVDLIAVTIIAFFGLLGWRKGFILYLAELLTTAISLGIGWYYYQQKQELLSSFWVFLGAFIILSLIQWLLFSPMTKRMSRETTSSYTNRCFGALCAAAWGTLIVVALILTVDLLPLEILFEQNIKARLYASRSYPIVQQLIPLQKIPLVDSLTYLGQISVDEEAKLRLSQQPQYQELLKNENFRQILDDQQLLNQLQAKDLPALLTNPKIRALLNDGQFIKQLMQLDFRQATISDD